MSSKDHLDYDFIIIGSGFGGSVSALRLVDKGYRVLVLEKGGRHPDDALPKTTWDLRRYVWLPEVGFRGFFKMTFLPHLTVLSGVGVGGGSIGYANTLPTPGPAFFGADSWSKLGRWQEELAPHYVEARRMLGVTDNPMLGRADHVMRSVARDMNREEHFRPAEVATYFGVPGERVPDPYFGGEGPERAGCTACGGCMLGCRHGAKNRLDKNYLFLAERRGARVEADTEVKHVAPLAAGGYAVEARRGTSPWSWRNDKCTYRAKNVIFAGGVLGTVALLLKLKNDPRGLPKISDRLGDYVRTNSEAITGVVSTGDEDFTEGVAIGSVYHPDANSHVQPTRYSAGSGLLRMITLPRARGSSAARRLLDVAATFSSNPAAFVRAGAARDWAKHTVILNHMQTTESYLRLQRGGSLSGLMNEGMTTCLGAGPAPSPHVDGADDVADRVAKKIAGVPHSAFTETLFNTPTTAHILGGCCMGEDVGDGVIDRHHRVFGYDGLYVVDGSAVSANPGVNPSMTITAMAERAMAHVATAAAEDADRTRSAPPKQPRP